MFVVYFRCYICLLFSSTELHDDVAFTVSGHHTNNDDDHLSNSSNNNYNIIMIENNNRRAVTVAFSEAH